MSPKLICITPIRNEAWCLNTFLKSTSQWADFIIIADQNSTDNSKEICESFSKVILIDNNELFYNEAERQSLLIKRAREIEGDKILFAFDADEIFPMGFQNTDDWNNILNSKPGDVFGFRWVNILPNQKNYFSSTFYYPWVFHDDDVTPHGRYVKEMHSMRIPFPQHADNGWHHIQDFSVIHLAHVHPNRVKSKNIFYQCLEVYSSLFSNPISSYRTYNYKSEKIYQLPQEWVFFDDGSLYFDYLILTDTIFWFDIEVIRMFNEKGSNFFSILPIWDSTYIKEMTHFKNVIIDSRSYSLKILHFYLKISHKFYPNLFIRLIDSFLKRLFL